LYSEGVCSMSLYKPTKNSGDIAGKMMKFVDRGKAKISDEQQPHSCQYQDDKKI
jgi:hypothetical protein